jgi:5-formyltetrahydrofolate cyclo-ligase
MAAEGFDGVREQKMALRRVALAGLASLSREQAAAASQRVCAELLKLLEGRPGPVMSFAPIRDPKRGVEVDLGALHRSLIRLGRLALPKIDWENRTMRAAVLPRAPALDDSMLRMHRYGVPEPALGEAVEAASLGTILVPGLCFDRRGGRLGRGAGFYDRFLSGVSEGSSPQLIGVCFGLQVVERVPMEAHDRRVDRVVTESSVEVCDA